MIGKRMSMLAVAALTAVATIAASPAPIDVPGEYRTPTATQVEASITRWSTDGSVRSVATTEQSGGETVIGLASDILFAFGSSALTPEASARISELTASIPAGTTVGVVGHTDDVGTDADNLALSQARAQSVATAIGRTDLVLQVSGVGETDPVASNGDPAGRQQNRRVEISYSP